ncbi:MAG TPA: alpha/beta hydrolase [Gaiellales bacterium]|jgi:pimeloyl-ACP methyl ester carboxylesterase
MSDLHVAVTGSGPPALLVHGSMSFGALAFSEQGPLAAEFELHVVDRRGFGRSPDGAGRVDFDADAADIAALLDPPMHVLGHSYGAIACMLAAARRPRSVRSLTVIEPPAFGLVPGDPAVAHLMARLERHIDARAGMTEEQYLRGFLEAWGFDFGTAGGPTLNAVARRSVRRSMGERLPTEARIPLDDLGRALFPVLVARGGWDAVPEPARAIGGSAFAAVCDLLVQRLGAQEAVFPGAAHQPQLLGEPFNRRVAAFWHAADAPHP